MAATEPLDEAPLAAAEIADAEALVCEAGWNQVAADWQAFRALGTVYAVRGGGRVVATAATLPYGPFAWISMVLVSGAHRRQGLGTRLLKRCVAALDERGIVPVLDATPAGRPLYRGLGFEDSWGYHRLARPAAVPPMDAQPSADISLRPISDADWAAVCAMDASAFGADRSGLLGRLRGRLAAAELMAERRGRLVGFMLGRDGRRAAQIGPLIAEDDAVAQALLARALSSLQGPIYLDLADSKPGIRAWLARCGFSAERPLTRMLYRRSDGFDDPARTYAVVGPEFG